MTVFHTVSFAFSILITTVPSSIYQKDRSGWILSNSSPFSKGLLKSLLYATSILCVSNFTNRSLARVPGFSVIYTVRSFIS